MMSEHAIRHVPVMGGSVKRFDATEAKKMRGVVDVVHIPRFENPYGSLGGVAVALRRRHVVLGDVDHPQNCVEPRLAVLEGELEVARHAPAHDLGLDDLSRAQRFENGRDVLEGQGIPLDVAIDIVGGVQVPIIRLDGRGRRQVHAARHHDHEEGSSWRRQRHRHSS